ncbi:hypothetical protein [Streptomyces sioyaensis]|uniref:hypothetical protein n=1 Tax=Streptomyces sioyaensis TaxID=67364 RepID=UPI003D72DF8B
MNFSTNRSQRMKTALGAGLAALAVLGTFATAQSANAATAQHPAKAARTSSAPYVINHYGEENADKGRAERSPAHLVLSEFTSAQGLHWKQWDGKQAVATGKVTGNWCLETCLDKPLNATVTLSDPKTVHGKRVYSSFTLKLADGAGKYDAEDLDGKRPLATS